MNRTPRGNPLSWSELAVLAMLAWLIFFGLAANGYTLLQSLFHISFGAAVLLIAWLWQRTLRQAAGAAPPLTPLQIAWSAAVLLALVAVMAALLSHGW